MKKILFAFLSVLILSGCGGKTTTESIVEASVERIERAEQIIQSTETVEQCKVAANDALLSAKVDILNAAESCSAEIHNLKSDLIRWKGYFWLLVAGIGVAIYLFIVRGLGKKCLTL